MFHANSLCCAYLLHQHRSSNSVMPVHACNQEALAVYVYLVRILESGTFRSSKASKPLGMVLGAG